jgi:glycerophosphoryl diester phosphodiesterase
VIAALAALSIMVAGMTVTTIAPVAKPIVIAHRGASGDRPEHTIEAYTLAIEQGADFIEPDLVLTRDGVLVARHENEISGTTDVASRPEFAGRKTKKSIDGEAFEGWFTEDFTLAELRTLRARERLPQLRPENTRHDGKYLVPTFEEIIALARKKSAETGRTIGIYPETKHPGYFASIGLPHEKPLLAALEKVGWTTAGAPVFIQSFEVENLKALARKTGVRLVQLVAAEGGPADRPEVRYADMLTPEGLAEIARYAHGIGPQKDLVIPRSISGTLKAPTTLVANAHAAGLKVHPWTFRAENYFLPTGYRKGIDPRARGDLAGEIRAYLDAGVDGLFSDHPGVAVELVSQRD